MKQVPMRFKGYTWHHNPRELTFENEKIKGYIQITKTSSEYNKYSELKKGSPLPDVTFEVYDFEDNLVDTITTDKEGKAITKELLKGCYKIKEISTDIQILADKGISLNIFQPEYFYSDYLYFY